MAQWYHFYHVEDEAEILVGAYDRWLLQLPFGPTQAERVLLHTDIMETAHERRFTVAQTGLNMLGFEVEHSSRINETIDHLERNFISKFSHEYASSGSRTYHRRKTSSASVEEDKRIQEDAVVEMMAWFDHETTDEGRPNRCDIGEAPTPSSLECSQLGSGLATTSILTPRSVASNVEPPIDIDDTSSDGIMEEQYRAALANLSFANLSHKRGWGPSNCPKTIREIRVRKKHKVQHDDGLVHKDESRNSNTTSMCLNNMLN